MNPKKLTCLIFLIFGLVACTGQPQRLESSRATVTPTILVINTQQIPATQTPSQEQIRCEDPSDTNRQTSPDGNWKINICKNLQNGYASTRFMQTNGKIIWDVSLYDAFISKLSDANSKEFFKNGEMRIVHWSFNGKYVYLSPFVCCIDGPMIFNQITTLYQLNLGTGKLKDMSFASGDIGFSPDDKYLVYREYPSSAHLINLETNEDIPFPTNAKYVNLGVFSWSPDSQKVVWVGALENWDKNLFEPTPVNQNGFSLLMLDLKTLKVTTLIENDRHFFVPMSSSYNQNQSAWADNQHIYLLKMNSLGQYEGGLLLYDVSTQSFLPSSTPSQDPTTTPEYTTQADPFSPPSSNPTALALQKEWQADHVLLSPDGQWAAPSNSSYSESDGAVIVIQNILTENRRTVSCKLFLPSCASIESIHWSKDSRYLYLAASDQYGETSLGQPLMSELARIDVETGKFEKLAGNTSAEKQEDGYHSPDAYDFSISSDDQYIGYVKSSYADNQDTVEFAILTTDKHKEVEKRTLDLASAGDLTWSPSDAYLVFQTVSPDGQGIAFYDLKSKILRYVIQHETDYGLSIQGWDVSRNLVMLVKMSWNDRLFSNWYLNPFTGEVSPAAATPNP